MGALLLNENPIAVLPSLAKAIGLNESLILQQIHYWNEINSKVGNNFKDGYYWTFNTYENWKEQFPFWSVDTIKRTISNLEKKGLVISSNYNKMKIDRTKWYRIDYNVLESLIDSPLLQNAPMDNSKMHRTIPKTNHSKKKINRKPTKNNKSNFTDYALKETAKLGHTITSNNKVI